MIVGAVAPRAAAASSAPGVARVDGRRALVQWRVLLAALVRNVAEAVLVLGREDLRPNRVHGEGAGLGQRSGEGMLDLNTRRHFQTEDADDGQARPKTIVSCSVFGACIIPVFVIW